MIERAWEYACLLTSYVVVVEKFFFTWFYVLYILMEKEINYAPIWIINYHWLVKVIISSCRHVFKISWQKTSRYKNIIFSYCHILKTKRVWGDFTEHARYTTYLQITRIMQSIIEIQYRDGNILNSEIICTYFIVRKRIHVRNLDAYNVS